MYYPYVNQPQQFRQSSQRMMTVTGTGTTSVRPDTVSIQLEVQTQSESLSQAQQENTQTMNQVIQTLLNLRIPEENIQTTGFNIFPMYDYVDGEQQFRGYQVTNTITVKLTNIDQAGHVIDAAVKNGVNQVSNIQFSIENPQKYYQQSLNEALKDAQAKAQTIAGSMQLNLDPVPIKIIEQINEPPTTYKTFTATDGSSTPIQSGQLSINATVKVKFQY
ncbi:hypothetical protein CIL05_09860 [Virgibacillus profundi]|uniref:SIMPL domain-containing protein n=1 Tax=Virgibacillus profundi TaxID=2024555 RepID=A0A2A2ID62_9BACI|nr:SIMPL domain-containing protein [Virgibacillus profundi]PAV29669.1 hypothetical protein CIL05_09860 [Virgibacillus profundi]PXY53841.1 DUF541 domain-containing protein [Virgibacillus profundi]